MGGPPRRCQDAQQHRKRVRRCATRAPRQHRCIRSASIAHTDRHSYKKKKMFDRALEYYQRSLRIKEERMGR